MAKKQVLPKFWWNVLETLHEKDALPDRILLQGKARTGKSTWAEYHIRKIMGVKEGVDLPVRSFTITGGSAPEDLIGTYMLRDGETYFAKGVVPLCMEKGWTVILNEVDHGPPEIHSTLHAILDDPAIARITLPTGEVITPKPGFRVICTMNGDVSNLPDTIQQRFDLVLRCDVPNEAIFTGMAPELAKAVENKYHFDGAADPFVEQGLNVGTAKAFHWFTTKGVEIEFAAALAFGGKKQAKEILSVLASASKS